MKVWMLIFDCCDFANFNGVFSTREKGIEAFFTLCKQILPIKMKQALSQTLPL